MTHAPCPSLADAIRRTLDRPPAAAGATFQVVLIDPYSVFVAVHDATTELHTSISAGVAPPTGTYVGLSGGQDPVVVRVRKRKATDARATVPLTIHALVHPLPEHTWLDVHFVGWISSATK